MLRARRYHLVLMFLLVPRPSPALQLSWSGGASDLTFASATRCTLIVHAGSPAITLPSEWRLMWIADSLGVNLVAADSLAACQTDTAQASTIDPPSTAADSAANQLTAHFCSGGSAQASIAYFILDQPGGRHGRLKVVALDPSDPDSDRVIESNEVTYNGGVGGDYAPVILHAFGVHQSLQLQVTAVGSGLLATNSLSIVASDSSWSLPLSITARSPLPPSPHNCPPAG